MAWQLPKGAGGLGGVDGHPRHLGEFRLFLVDLGARHVLAGAGPHDLRGLQRQVGADVILVEQWVLDLGLFQLPAPNLPGEDVQLVFHARSSIVLAGH